MQRHPQRLIYDLIHTFPDYSGCTVISISIKIDIFPFKEWNKLDSIMLNNRGLKIYPCGKRNGIS